MLTPEHHAQRVAVGYEAQESGAVAGGQQRPNPGKDGVLVGQVLLSVFDGE